MRAHLPQWLHMVAPFAGAWIEILDNGRVLKADYVAPFAGAWIEIIGLLQIKEKLSSLPSRERGLKS